MELFSNLFISLFFTALDQFSKKLISAYIREGESLTIIPNFFSLTNVKNSGAAWSILEGKKTIFIIITIITVIFFSIELIRSKNKKMLYKFSCCLIIGGALGNFIDRIFVGKVTDFLSFNIFGYNFPVFNVADICLTIGVFLYIISSFTHKKK